MAAISTSIENLSAASSSSSTLVAMTKINSNFKEDPRIVPSQDEGCWLEDGKKKFAPFEDLPDEIFLRILYFVSAPNPLLSLCLVSRSWNSMISTPWLWYLHFQDSASRCGWKVKPKVKKEVSLEEQFSQLGLEEDTKTDERDWRHLFKQRWLLQQRWDKIEGFENERMVDGTESVYCLQFDEEKLVTGSRDKSLKLYLFNPPSLSYEVVAVQEFIATSHPSPMISDTRLAQDAAISPSSSPTPLSSSVVSSAGSPSILPTLYRKFHAHTASVLCLRFLNSSQTLMTGSSDCSIVVWDISSPTYDYRVVKRLENAHTMGVLDIEFDNRWLISCSRDTTIKIWDRNTFDCLRVLETPGGPINAIQMRGNTLCSASGDNELKQYSLPALKLVRHFHGHTRGLACMKFSVPNGKYLASGSNDKTVKIWDVVDYNEYHQPEPAEPDESSKTLPGHDALVRGLALDDERDIAVSVGYDKTIRIWDLKTGGCKAVMRHAHKNFILDVGMDFRKIITGGADGNILIVDFGKDLDLKDFC